MKDFSTTFRRVSVRALRSLVKPGRSDLKRTKRVIAQRARMHFLELRMTTREYVDSDPTKGFDRVVGALFGVGVGTFIAKTLAKRRSALLERAAEAIQPYAEPLLNPETLAMSFIVAASGLAGISVAYYLDIREVARRHQPQDLLYLLMDAHSDHLNYHHYVSYVSEVLKEPGAEDIRDEFYALIEGDSFQPSQSESRKRVFKEMMELKNQIYLS